MTGVGRTPRNSAADFTIPTFNVQSIATAERLAEFEAAEEKVKLDLIYQKRKCPEEGN